MVVPGAENVALPSGVPASFSSAIRTPFSFTAAVPPSVAHRIGALAGLRLKVQGAGA